MEEVGVRSNSFVRESFVKNFLLESGDIFVQIGYMEEMITSLLKDKGEEGMMEEDLMETLMISPDSYFGADLWYQASMLKLEDHGKVKIYGRRCYWNFENQWN